MHVHSEVSSIEYNGLIAEPVLPGSRTGCGAKIVTVASCRNCGSHQCLLKGKGCLSTTSEESCRPRYGAILQTVGRAAPCQAPWPKVGHRFQWKPPSLVPSSLGPQPTPSVTLSSGSANQQLCVGAGIVGTTLAAASAQLCWTKVPGYHLSTSSARAWVVLDRGRVGRRGNWVGVGWEACQSRERAGLDMTSRLHPSLQFGQCSFFASALAK